MDYESQAKKIEQEEIIEHYVTESRRLPGTSSSRVPLQEILTETIERRYNEELPIHDFYRTSQSPLQPTSSALSNDAERRLLYRFSLDGISLDTVANSSLAILFHFKLLYLPVKFASIFFLNFQYLFLSFRFYATGERDCSRDASFMQTSGIVRNYC